MIMFRRFVLTAVFSAGLVLAQTKPTQLPVGSLQPSGVAGCFIGLDSSGRFQCIPIPQPVIPTTPTRLCNQFAKVLDPGAFTWTLPSVPNPATLELHRNGLLMAPGIDYTVLGAVVTFSAAQTSTTTDVVLASYIPVSQ